MPAPVDPTDPFRALADPTRRQIVGLLAAGPLPVRLIAARFPAISRPAVSKHLRTLREARLVSEERTGRERFYRLEVERIAMARDWLVGVAAGRRSEEAGAPPRPRRKARPRKAAARRPASSKPARGSRASPSGKRPAAATPGEPDDWKSW